MIDAKKVIYFGLITLVQIIPNYSHADIFAGPSYSTQMSLESWFVALKAFQKSCGRFPNSKEGLKSFGKKPVNLKCDDKFPTRGYLFSTSDGWNEPFNYKSDGKTYYLKASHGFFLTEKTPPKENGFHWENPNPPIDPEPKPAPSGLMY